MKFTLSWLKKFLKTDASLEEIIAQLTKNGLEVEEVVNQADIYKPFIVAEIISAVSHPEAEKLRVCQVNNGKEILQIVCGAPNARAGIKVVLAPIGAVIPTNSLKIKESKIRNVNSYGMMCSARELDLGEDHAGIIELNDSYVVGSSFAESYGLNEVVIEVSITPNRGDCLGVYGIARDLAASGLGELCSVIHDIPGMSSAHPGMTSHRDASFLTERSGDREYHEETPGIPGQAALARDDITGPIAVELNDSNCFKFIGRYFKNVKNPESPKWLQDALKSIGVKPISSLVDITNYFTFSFNRPLHVFDADLIGKINVRKALPNEEFEALNNKTYKLKGEELVVADDNKILALAGIIGGKDSGVSENSKNIFLEIGLFDADNIAKTSRIHQIDSDAKYRNERKLDPGFMEQSLDLATKMILEICGGEASAPITVENVKNSITKIDFPLSELKKRIGISYEKNHVIDILSKLGFKIEDNGENLLLEVPSWRSDISIKEDIVEEVARIDGYDKIVSTALPNRAGSLDLKQKNLYHINRMAASLGLDEIITWSFMDSKKAALFSELEEELYIKNPISIELDYMRPSILANLLEVAENNQNRGINSVQIFEVGSVFKSLKPEGQVLTLTGLRTGMNNERNHYQDYRKVDLFDSKADIFNILTQMEFDPNKLQYITSNLPKYYHPGRASSLVLGKNIIGYFGELHPSIIKAYNLNGNAVGFELFMDNIPLARSKFGRKGAMQFSEYQLVERDFAFVMNKDISSDLLIRTISQIDKKLIKAVNIFDIYQGEHIAIDKKSIALSVVIQADDRTLTEKELEELSQKIIDAAAKGANATLR